MVRQVEDGDSRPMNTPSSEENTSSETLESNDSAESEFKTLQELLRNDIDQEEINYTARKTLQLFLNVLEREDLSKEGFMEAVRTENIEPYLANVSHEDQDMVLNLELFTVFGKYHRTLEGVKDQKEREKLSEAITDAYLNQLQDVSEEVTL